MTKHVFKEIECKICSFLFTPTGSKTEVCESCRIGECQECGILFPKRIDYMDAKYCSKDCRKKHPIAFWKGKNLTESAKKKMSEKHKILAQQGIVPPSWLGKKREPKTPEHIEKWRKSVEGKISHTQEFKDDMSKRVREAWAIGEMQGHPMSEEHKLKISKALKGENSYLWEGGISPLKQKIMQLYKYILWKRAILERDNRTCQICESTERPHVNHIVKFSVILNRNNIQSTEEAEKCSELWNTNNGIVLCMKCHLSIVTQHEEEWENYFNFNLMNRGFLPDSNWNIALENEGGNIL